MEEGIPRYDDLQWVPLITSQLVYLVSEEGIPRYNDQGTVGFLIMGFTDVILGVVHNGILDLQSDTLCFLKTVPSATCVQ